MNVNNKDTKMTSINVVPSSSKNFICECVQSYKDGRKIHVDQATSDFIADLEHKLVTNLNVIMH